MLIQKKQFLNKKIYPFIFLLIVSLLPRLNFLHRISSWWRSSHTLINSFWFQKEGISLLHPQYPIFGPPWQVPFDFPLYQAISVIFSNITSINLTTASRIVILFCFYYSAVILFLLCYEFLANYLLSFIILFVYLWLPYTIYFSTEVLIDYLSVAFALSYIYFLRKFLISPKSLGFFALSVISGSLGGLVKVTTMAITILPMILIVFHEFHQWGWRFNDLQDTNGFLKLIKEKQKILLMIALIAIIPLISIQLWTGYSDAIKQSSVFTAWLTSKRMTGWNYGSWNQKTTFTNWWNWLKLINNYFMMGGILLFFFFLGIIFLYRMPANHRSFYGAALGSIFLTILIFFNLYQHDYYYIALSPYISICIGFGIFTLIKYILPGRNWLIVFSLIFLFFVSMKWVEQYKVFQSNYEAQVNYENSNHIPMASKVRKVTPENEYVIAFQEDWYPNFFYYVQRKGLIISPREYNKYTCDLLNKYNYSTVVIVDQPQDSLVVEKVLACFRSVDFINQRIYKVTP